MELIISVESLSRSFGPVAAVNDLSLAVRPGEIYGLVGPDGAGKTTTFRLLVGALRPDKGGGTIAGHDLVAGIEQARMQMGYLPQRFSLYHDLTVAENLAFLAGVHGLSGPKRRQREAQLLDFVGLTEFSGRLAGKLSGGMKQKLGLAAALVHRPRLLLLDEPTGGVDPVTRQDFWQLISRAVANEGVTVVISTPYMDEAARCTRIGFLSGGRLLTEGTVQELVAPLHGRILELIATPRRLAREVAAAGPDVEEVHAFGSKLHLRLRPGADTGAQQRLSESLLAAGVAIEKMRPITPSLEDAFIALLTADSRPLTVPK